jgi:putative FmdB family regulatory protein
VPTYQYACTECGHAFDQFQSFTDDALTECPQCQGRLRKLFNAVGVVFKGSGFYRNDSRATAGSSNGSSGSSEGSGSGESGAAAKESSSTKESSTSGTSGSGAGSTSDASKSTAATGS